MLFNSLTFGVFFAVVLLLHTAPLPWRVKKINLLAASYLFYAAWNPPFVLLLWLSTLVDWEAARRIHNARTAWTRNCYLLLSLAVNLGVLGYFKYGAFLLQNFTELAASLGLRYQPPEWNIILPVGISFYTFQTMAYTLDVYLKRAEPSRSLLDFSLFVTFFPQLVAGPIVRPSDLTPQFAAPRRASRDQLGWGLWLMALGLFLKVVLADGFLGPSVDAVFGAAKPVPALDAWIGAIAFSGQIFCDFSGYTTIAIGAALCLGFSLPNNFNSPYAAIGFSDFWRRWHITLSTWLRDYLYIPLGGNRAGPLKAYRNLMITMLLGGLWHGASWTFVAWGGLHGSYLVVERWVRGRWPAWKLAGPAARGGAMIATFAVVTITWVFFRAQTFPEAARLLHAMSGLGPAGEAVLRTNDVLAVSGVMGALLATQAWFRGRSLESFAVKAPAWSLSVAGGFALLAVFMSGGSNDAFIYFQF